MTFSSSPTRGGISLRLHPLVAAVFAVCAPVALAQTPAPSAASASPEKLTPVVVTGNPLRLNQPDASAQRVSGAELQWRRAGNLGETLDGLPGVSATAFGPQSSRPVLRGLDGDRLRILSNGGASVDASSLSFDHAVAIDPLVLEAIEVVRGPSALLYGGNALGGVVNALDNRVPKGAGGSAIEARFGGAADERAVAAVLEGGARAGEQGASWHGDFSRRLTDDLRTPAFSFDGEDFKRVRNSDGQQRSGAVGVSYALTDGFTGLSLEDLRHQYGVTAEPDVRIRLQRQRLANEGEWRWADGPLRRASWQASRTRYAHDEVEGSGEVGTQFRMRGSDARLELEHAPLGDLRGVFGIAMDEQRFSALGAEAFVPGTRTRQRAAFVFEQWQSGNFSLSGGGRLERVDQTSAGDAPDAEEARFGEAQSRRFSPRSLSGQAAWQATPALRVQLLASQSQRAPSNFELYANGLHIATAAFERGDPNLGLERAKSLEAALVFQDGGTQAQLNLYTQRFSRFIALEATGETFTAEGEDGGDPETFPVYAFRSVPARLNGWEASVSHKLADRIAGGHLTLQAQVEQTQGRNSATGEPLPRIAPRRARLAADWQAGPWSLRASWTDVAKQTRVSADDTATDGYQRLDLGMSYAFKIGDLDALWAVKGQNLTNELAYSASTISTIRGLAPLAGRSWFTSVLVRF